MVVRPWNKDVPLSKLAFTFEAHILISSIAANNSAFSGSSGIHCTAENFQEKQQNIFDYKYWSRSLFLQYSIKYPASEELILLLWLSLHDFIQWSTTYPSFQRHTAAHISPVAHFVFEESPVKSRGLFNFFFIQERRKGH